MKRRERGADTADRSRAAVKDEKYPKGAITERGKRLYDERVRPNVDEEAQQRRPEARGRLFFTRVGLGYTAKIGGRPLASAPEDD